MAVVRAGSNITRLEDLRNRKICFSGIGHMAGWIVPIATLLEKDVLKVVDCNNLVKTATDFFGPSCAPNALNYKYNPSGMPILLLYFLFMYSVWELETQNSV